MPKLRIITPCAGILGTFTIGDIVEETELNKDFVKYGLAEYVKDEKNEDAKKGGTKKVANVPNQQ